MNGTPIGANVSNEIRMHIRQISIFTSGNIIAHGLSVFTAILLARHLSPSGYGLLVGAYAAAILTSIIFNWGLDTWILRQSKKDVDPKIIAGAVIVIKFGLGLIWAIALFAVLLKINSTMFQQSLVIVIGLDVLLDGILRSEIAAFNLTEKHTWAAIALIISRGGKLAGTLLLISLNSQSPVDFALSRFLASGVSVLIAGFLLKPDFRYKHHIQLVQTLRESFPFALSDFLASVYAQIDLVLLSLIRGNSEEIGVYFPARNLINATFLIPSSAYTVLIPPLSREYAKDPSTFIKSFKRLFILFIALGAVLWLGISILGLHLIEWILGAAYAKTSLMIVGLGPIGFMKSLSFACATLLVVVGWQKKRVIAQSFSAIANVASNIFLITAFGVWGAILSYLVSELILLTGYSSLALNWLTNNQDRHKVATENNG